MANSKTFLHVFVIGAASNNSSTGQIPMSDNIKEFQESHPNIMPYFYFIDPLHRNLPDFLMLHELMKDEIPLCAIANKFDPMKLRDEYKILAEDEVLFIDYAQIADTENAWKSLVGDNKRMFFYIAHVMGNPVLDMNVAYDTAKAGKYTISSDCKIPKNISKSHKASLIKELEKLINYARLLPTHSDSPPPPDWLIAKDKLIRDGSINDLFLLRAESESIIETFFRLNGTDIYTLKETQWFSVGKQIIENA